MNVRFTGDPTLPEDCQVEFNGTLGELRELLKKFPLPDYEAEYLRIAATNKIEAIKLYRERTGQGLKESKDYIEALCARGPR